MSEDDGDDPDRAAILARRKRWIAMAVAGAAATVTTACSHPCLSPTDVGMRDAGADAADGGDGGDAGP